MVDGMPLETDSLGSHSLRSEVEHSAEAGYRFQSGQHWSTDISVFYSTYGRLIANRTDLTPQIDFSGETPVLRMTSVSENPGAGRSYGGEVWAIWQIHPSWRLAPSYSYLREWSWLPDVPGSALYWGYQPQNMRHQGRVRLEHNLSRAWQVDLMARVRSRESTFQTPGSVQVDAHVSYRPFRSSEFSLTVKNLTDRQVLENYSEFCFPAIPMRRTLLVKWTQRF